METKADIINNCISDLTEETYKVAIQFADDNAEFMKLNKLKL